MSEVLFFGHRLVLFMKLYYHYSLAFYHASASLITLPWLSVGIIERSVALPYFATRVVCIPHPLSLRRHHLSSTGQASPSSVDSLAYPSNRPISRRLEYVSTCIQ